jgi:hypothetical protein
MLTFRLFGTPIDEAVVYFSIQNTMCRHNAMFVIDDESSLNPEATPNFLCRGLGAYILHQSNGLFINRDSNSIIAHITIFPRQ